MALFDYIDENPEGFTILVRDSPVSQQTGSFASLIVDIADGGARSMAVGSSRGRGRR